MNDVQIFKCWWKNFKFLSKFLSYKGVSHRNEGQNPKTITILEFLVMKKGGINLTSHDE